MKKIVLFGAGQAGAAVSRLLGADWEAVCFADNDREKWGAFLEDLPVLSPAESLLREPDCFCLCALNAGRREQMARQLRELGFAGPVYSPESLRMFDARVGAMRLLARQIRQLRIPGDAAELGVYRGDFAALINAALPDRTLHLFDTFEGFPGEDVKIEAEAGYSKARAADFSGTSVEMVEKRLLHREKARFYKGRFPASFAPCMELRFAFVSIDADLYAPTAAALPLFWERLSPGGVLMIHDADSQQFAGVGKAVSDFCREQGIFPMPVCDLHGSLVLRRG